MISREGASNRKNGILILDVTNPSEVNILSEYTKNLTELTKGFIMLKMLQV